MKPEIANLCLQFLSRVDIKGQEAQSLYVCQQTLSEILQRQPEEKVQNVESVKK